MKIKDSVHSHLETALHRANTYQKLTGFKANVRENESGLGFVVEVPREAYRLLTGKSTNLTKI